MAPTVDDSSRLASGSDADAASREWADRLDAAEHRLAQVAVDAIERSVAGAAAQLRDHVDQAVWNAVTRPRGGVRHFIRSHTPLWVRRIVVRTLQAIWWSFTLQLPRRLRQRRDQAAEEARRAERTDVRELIQREYPLIQPLGTYRTGTGPRSISVLARNLAPPGLLAGDRTAVIVGALLAERTAARLRLVTRGERGRASQLADLLSGNGLDPPANLELLHLLPGSAEVIPLSPRDAFITSDWRDTRAILPGIGADRVIQVVETDERDRYALGDERLRCQETLGDVRVRLLIDGEPLFQELASGPEPLPELADRATCFTPAFPVGLFHHDPAVGGSDARLTLVLISEPPGTGPLFWRTLEGVSRAIEDGVLASDEWRCILVGRPLPQVQLPGSVRPELFEELTQARYASIVRQADLGLALTGSHLASYPARALLASGAVVVTDEATRRASGLAAAEGVVSSGLSVEGICSGIAAGVLLARDRATRGARCARWNVARDWRASLEGTISRCVEWTDS